MNSFIKIQPWIHYFLHCTEVIYEFRIWIHIWLHRYEFSSLNSNINSFLRILMWYFSWPWMQIWIHIMNSLRFHDHEFICYISWPMNSDMNSCILLWNHKWNQGAKVPDECHNSIPPPAGLLRKPVRCQLSVNRYQLVSTQYQDGYLFQVKKVTFWSESLRKLASWLSVVQI